MGTWDIPDAQAAMPGLLPAGGAQAAARGGVGPSPRHLGAVRRATPRTAHTLTSDAEPGSATPQIPWAPRRKEYHGRPAPSRLSAPGGAARRAQEGALSAGCLAASP